MDSRIKVASPRSTRRCTTCGGSSLEKSLHQAIRRAAKVDKALWLNDAVKGGSWKGAHKFSKPRRATQGRLRDVQGQSVRNECRADRMAEYLQTMQWGARHVQAIDVDMFGPALLVREEVFIIGELIKVIRKLKNGRAASINGIPA